jgi:glycolate oxidase iron-sulfur subunit
MTNTQVNKSVTSAFFGVDVPSDDFLTNCIHCGYCLPHCPTYALTLREKSSPRGRIRLMKSVAEGEMAITRGFIDEMYYCLDCQACETACPAGVKYGALVEASRTQIERQNLLTRSEHLIKKLIMDWVFLSNRRIKFIARLLRFYQNSGIESFLRSTKLLRLISPKLARIQPLSPRISRRFTDETVAEILVPHGPRKHRVGFISGCLMNVMFADVNDDTIQVLLENGCEVVIPHGQECCGSLQAHNGLMDTARSLARKMIDIFDSYRLDAIVMNSAGCGAFMKEYGHVLSDDKEYAMRAARFAKKVMDLSEFLVGIGMKSPKRAINKRVAHHEACHLVHAQKVSEQPRQVLEAIPGLKLTNLDEATWCCGSAGIYNIIRYDDSMKLLDRKMENLRTTGADLVVMGNPGCLAQIKYGVQREEMNMEVVHLATLLRRAYGM